MRLKNNETETIEKWWNSDLDIEIERQRYTAILESNVYYSHYNENGVTIRSKRHRGDKRKLKIYNEKTGDIITLIGFDKGFNSPNTAIEFLKNNGSLLNLI